MDVLYQWLNMALPIGHNQDIIIQIVESLNRKYIEP
jgi:hypothetical protein